MPVSPAERSPVDERGVTAVLVAATAVLLLAFAAIAIDLGAGFTERRLDQTASDVGVMAGAVELIESPSYDGQQIAAAAIQEASINLTAPPANAEWESCVDAERATLNASGDFNLQPLPAPWNSAITLDCVSYDPTGFLRLKVPDQTTDAQFAQVIGVSDLTTSAAAIANIGPRAAGGTLPFGLLSTAGDGSLQCLRDNSGGNAAPPCDGGNTGSYGNINSPVFRPPSQCGGNKNALLAKNTAAGIDHNLFRDDDFNPVTQTSSDEVLDNCYNAGVDTLDTGTGLGQGLEDGLFSGGGFLPATYTPRLKNSPQLPASIFGESGIDNRPLWDYFTFDPAGVAPAGFPATCGGFDGGQADWDAAYWISVGNPEPAPVNEPNRSYQHLAQCLSDYAALATPPQLFGDEDGPRPYLGDTPRFAYAPKFHEAGWPPGASQPRHIDAFKAVFVQTLWFGTGNLNNVKIFSPGEACITVGGSACSYSSNAGNLRQITGWIIPDTALPEELRGSNAGGRVVPSSVSLFR